MVVVLQVVLILMVAITAVIMLEQMVVLLHMEVATIHPHFPMKMI
jgi:hypothetical protein